MPQPPQHSHAPLRLTRTRLDHVAADSTAGADTSDHESDAAVVSSHLQGRRAGVEVGTRRPPGGALLLQQRCNSCSSTWRQPSYARMLSASVMLLEPTCTPPGAWRQRVKGGRAPPPSPLPRTVCPKTMTPAPHECEM